MKLIQRICLLFLFSSSQIHGQNPSVLDTAPGVPNTAAAPASIPVPVPAGTALITNGDLESATIEADWPDGWNKTENGIVTWKADGAKHYFNFVSQKPQEHVEIFRIIDIPPGVTGMEFSVRYRVAGLKPGRFPEDSARTILEFLDAGGKPLAAAPPVTFAADAAVWTDFTERFAVPAGAVRLAIMPCLFRVETGTLDLAKIQVTTLGDVDAATVTAEAAATAAKKLVDQMVILEQEIAAPAKSLEIHVSGNRLVDTQGKDVLLQGVNIGNLSIRPDEEHKILWAAHVALTDWNANVIRLPVLDSYWFGIGRGKYTNNDAEAYRSIADKVIQMAAGKGAYVVFDLHRYMTPDQSCVDFWKDAAARYKNNPAVLFDILNEPHGTTWDIWRNGGSVEMKQKDGTSKTLQGVGMQALVEAVRGTGAKNVIVAGGLSYAYDITGIVNGYALDDKSGNGIMYATHFYNWHTGWDKHIAATAAKYPVLVGECGADINKMGFIPLKQQENPYTWAPDAISYIQKNHLNWTAWCMHTRATPDLLLDWDYSTPTPFWGAFVKDALNGKVYEMRKER